MILAGARAMTAMAKPSARLVLKPARFLQNSCNHRIETSAHLIEIK
jgi:hypothetical protein